MWKLNKEEKYYFKRSLIASFATAAIGFLISLFLNLDSWNFFVAFFLIGMAGYIIITKKSLFLFRFPGALGGPRMVKGFWAIFFAILILATATDLLLQSTKFLMK